MMHRTTATYIAHSVASDRRLAADRDRRAALARSSAQPDVSRPNRLAGASGIVSAHLRGLLRRAAAAR